MGETDIKRIYERLDSINTSLAEIVTNTKHQADAIKDHEDRVRALEKWQWKSIGFSTAIASAISTLIALLAMFLAR